MESDSTKALCSRFDLSPKGASINFDQMSKFVAETQTDFQVREQKIEELEEVIFQNAATQRSESFKNAVKALQAYRFPMAESSTAR